MKVIIKKEATMSGQSDNIIIIINNELKYV